MSKKEQAAICVTTSKPTISLTPGGGGGSITILCPHTGSILSSLRPYGDQSQKSLLGISSLSFSPKNDPLVTMMAYGANTNNKNNKNDTYGFLLSMKNTSSPPTLHWKCRLPESDLTKAGLLISKCGHFLVGGSSTGNIHVWSIYEQGRYLRVVKAHYRAITALAWSDCGLYLITGGADGMIHAFSLMDLVQRGTPKSTIHPLRTWSALHHLPITCILSTAGSRIISASEDGQITMLELFSQQVLFQLQVSDVIRSLALHNNNLLLVGTDTGVIYTIDLDIHAVRSTSQNVVIKRRKLNNEQDIISAEDQVFDSLVENTNDKSTTTAYKGELRGHERSVTAMMIMDSWLISGDEAGILRIWDLTSRGCLRVVKPYATSLANSTEDANKQTKNTKKEHPITSISLVPIIIDNDDNGSSKKKSIVDILQAPLKRFPEQHDTSKQQRKYVPVPFLKPKVRTDSFLFRNPLE